jgi:AcrR family transcriptional regulator
MPRNGEVVRRRLQEAALALFDERGYDQTTSAEIAAKAGVTERTFFRHFPEKREVLFGGEAALSAILTSAVQGAPPALGAWDTLFRAFQAAEPLLVENRPFSEPRRRIIASSSPLQEREAAKAMSLTVGLASALRERGVPDRLASLAAQVGMAAFSQAFAAWLDGEPGNLGEHLAKAFHEVRDLTS